MTLDVFLADLRERQVQLRIEGESLHCDAPPGVLTSRILRQIAQRKPEVLAFLRRSAESQNLADAITPADRTRPLMLSFALERFWFLDRFIADKAVYNVPLALALDGPLNSLVLAAALSALVVRHEALRTVFNGSGNGAIQTIGPAYTLELPHEDLLTLTPAPREKRLRKLAADELRRPFDLGSGRLLRARLVVMATDYHVLLITIHHIACDAWSLNLLVDDLRAAYRCGGEVALSAPSLQYADFASWQRSQVCAAHGGELLARYQACLLGCTTGTVLPSDRPRPVVQSYRGACHRVDLSGATLLPLRRLASSEDASLFMVLLAVTKLLLFRYTRQDDISVGVPISGRNRSELQGVVGCFLNTLVLRTQVHGDMSGRELLRAVREVCLEGYELAEVPFEKLVEALQQQRDLSYNPLFQDGYLFLALAATMPRPDVCTNPTNP